MTQSDQPTPLEARSSGPLTGKVRVPGDKSISHRALILGALAVGETRISGLLEGEDVLNTARSMRALGATVERTGDFAWLVRGVGVAGFAEPEGPLDFGNSGTGCRLVMGAVAGCPISAVFDGDASLRSRPMRRILDPLELMGAKAGESKEGGRLPLTLHGAHDPVPILYRTPVASAQIKSAVLLAGLAAPGVTTVIEQEASRDHTELMLKHFGAEIVSTTEGSHGRRIALTGQPELHGAEVVVPADPSSAAFPVVAALVVEGSDVTFSDVMTNPLRTGLYEVLEEMGADLSLAGEHVASGEIVADMSLRHARLQPCHVEAPRIPAMIDEIPALAVACAFADGESVIEGLGELRVKESDRLAAIVAGLTACGVATAIDGDALRIFGKGQAKGGGQVATHGDHRISMAFLALGLAAEKPVEVDEAEMIATSFPGFAEIMRSLGADIQ